MHQFLSHHSVVLQVGYQTEADKYFIFIAGCIGVTLVAHSLGLSISAGAPNVSVSMALGPAAFIPLILLGETHFPFNSKVVTNPCTEPLAFPNQVVSFLVMILFLPGWSGT